MNEHIGGNCNSAAKQSIVWQIESKRVQAAAHVSRSMRARINIAQSQRHQIDVLHDQTGKVLEQCILCTNIEKLCTIKMLIVSLLDNEYFIMYRLLAEKIVKIVEKILQLLVSIAEWHDDGGGELRIAVIGPEFA